MQIDPGHLITRREQLREIVGEVGPRVAQKVIDHIDPICATFIARSPYAVLATRGANGLLDVSPKGDPAGFVDVLSPKVLALPDRLGNGRFDSYENLFDDPTVALLFLIPGHSDTLRVAGDGRITRDPELLARYPVNGKEPRFVLLIEVREAFLHCSKSSVRSNIWSPERWPDTDGLPSLAEAMVAHGKLSIDVPEMQDIIDRDREMRLY
ncbi:MAG: MSMEG_1061 family FMN-dependent PPOX-type flavoprotein [Minwuia sp.]|uniref:MSMEG_1061 family FMN-dependent PPOX-type flavoprotein n=1 Tax=Minwuia sp. TaxID=2493630 RepID=UPI003A8631AB